MHRKGPDLVTETSGPDYQRIADDLLNKIRSGEYPVGAPIPSTPRLEQEYGVSKTPVRQAVDLLRREGVLAGQSGKAVYVRALPDEAAAGARDLKALAGEVAELKRRVHDNGELWEIVSRIEANLRELYAKTAYEYPGEEPSGPPPERVIRHG